MEEEELVMKKTGQSSRSTSHLYDLGTDRMGAGSAISAVENACQT